MEGRTEKGQYLFCLYLNDKIVHLLFFLLKPHLKLLENKHHSDFK